MCKPGSFFKFFGSIQNFSGRLRLEDGKPDENLFLSCTEVLRPMLDLLDVDHATAEGLKSVECALGSALFDAMAHMMALSSESFYFTKKLDRIVIEKSVTSVRTGLNAGSSRGYFVGRNLEIEKYDRFLSPVFQCDTPQRCPFVLIHGQVGTGKTYLAEALLEQKRQLLREEQKKKKTSFQAAQNAVKSATEMANLQPQNETALVALAEAENNARIAQVEMDKLNEITVYSHKIQGRSEQDVCHALYNMGTHLIDEPLPYKEVLRKLYDFLKEHRFVIIADDINEIALAEIFRRVPKSSQPCALVVTTQFGNIVEQYLSKHSQLHEGIFQFQLAQYRDYTIEVGEFDSKNALELVNRICKGLDHEESEFFVRMTPYPSKIMC